MVRTQVRQTYLCQARLATQIPCLSAQVIFNSPLLYVCIFLLSHLDEPIQSGHQQTCNIYSCYSKMCKSARCVRKLTESKPPAVLYCVTVAMYTFGILSCTRVQDFAAKTFSGSYTPDPMGPWQERVTLPASPPAWPSRCRRGQLLNKSIGLLFTPPVRQYRI